MEGVTNFFNRNFFRIHGLNFTVPEFYTDEFKACDCVYEASQLL